MPQDDSGGFFMYTHREQGSEEGTWHNLEDE
jgi:hypothetical protein